MFTSGEEQCWCAQIFTRPYGAPSSETFVPRGRLWQPFLCPCNAVLPKSFGSFVEVSISDGRAVSAHPLFSGGAGGVLQFSLIFILDFFPC